MAVVFEDVTFGYPGRPPVLDGLRLTVPSGSVVAIVGRSGAGKTTALKLVNRLLLPVRGRVLVQGRDTREWDPIALRRRTGYIFQDVGLFPHMTVEANAGIVPRLEGWPRERIAARVDELLTLVGLPRAEFGGRYPDELSGGQRQRVGLVRALAASPDVLLMDEPFGALDPETREDVRAQFAALRRQLGMTALLVTHDLAEARALADDVRVLEGGGPTLQGSEP